MNGELVIEEIWKPVRGYEGLYEISSLGRLKSLPRDVCKGDIIQHRREKIKKQWLNQDGYRIVKLSKDGQSRNVATHILVAEAFCGDKQDGMEVDHIDYNRQNNCANNLVWRTHVDNIAHSAMAGRYSGRDGENNSNYGNRALHQKYVEHPELTIAQSRPGKTNGRSIPVVAVCDDGVEIYFDYIRECANWLIESCMKDANRDYVANKISYSAKHSTSYKGYYFKRV